MGNTGNTENTGSNIENTGSGIGVTQNIEGNANVLALVIPAIASIGPIKKKIVELGERVDIIRNELSDDIHINVKRDVIKLGSILHRHVVEPKIIETVLYLERYNRVRFAQALDKSLDSLTDDELVRIITSKEAAERLAFSLALIGDYIEYLQTGKWEGIKGNSSNTVSNKTIEFRDRLNIPVDRFCDVVMNIDKKDLKEFKESLDTENKNSIEELQYELYIAYKVIEQMVKEGDKKDFEGIEDTEGHEDFENIDESVELEGFENFDSSEMFEGSGGFRDLEGFSSFEDTDEDEIEIDIE